MTGQRDVVTGIRFNCIEYYNFGETKGGLYSEFVYRNSLMGTFELRPEKTCFLHLQKQRRS